MQPKYKHIINALVCLLPGICILIFLSSCSSTGKNGQYILDGSIRPDFSQPKNIQNIKPDEDSSVKDSDLEEITDVKKTAEVQSTVTADGKKQPATSAEAKKNGTSASQKNLSNSVGGETAKKPGLGGRNMSMTVYWTPGGKSFHYKKDCSALKRSSSVISGTLSKAISEGKTDPCNRCAGGE